MVKASPSPIFATRVRQRKPNWTVSTRDNAQHIIRRPWRPQRAIGNTIRRRVIRAQSGAGKGRSFRDARNMQEDREWAAELIMLLESHDLLA
jgi:hypothetical protein